MPTVISAAPMNTAGLVPFLSNTPDVLFPVQPGTAALVINQVACDQFINDLQTQIPALVAAAPAALAALAAGVAAAKAALPGFEATLRDAIAAANAAGVAAGGGGPAALAAAIAAINAVSRCKLSAATTVDEFILNTPMTRAGAPASAILYTFGMAFDQLLFSRPPPCRVREFVINLLPINIEAIARGSANPTNPANPAGCSGEGLDVVISELEKLEGLKIVLIARAPKCPAYVPPPLSINPHVGLSLGSAFGRRGFYEKYLKYKQKYIDLKNQLVLRNR
jgi:hypothetical protein